MCEREGVVLHLVRADLRAIPLRDNYFDLVFSVGVMEHFKNIEPAMVEQGRVLKNGGFLLIDVPHSFSVGAIRKRAEMLLGRWPIWERSFTVNELEKILSRYGFEVVRVYSRRVEPVAVFSLLSKISKEALRRMEYSWYARHFCANVGIIGRKSYLETSKKEQGPQ